ncbi:MAG: transcription-repair coupling factor [Paenibacillaceae bacterium ZCTH02-B3]|nr:MAG: transcription-repair coupling factor [Paenibacillaceae bacterium ZCTH02-B3]
MKVLLDSFASEPDFRAVLQGLERGMKEQLVAGLSGSARQVMIASLHRELDRPVLVVTHNMYSAQKIADDLQECLPQDQVLLYPANELIAAEAAVSSPETSALRVDALLRLASGFRGVLVAPFAGVRRHLPERTALIGMTEELRVGQTVPMEAFLRRLVALGYERTDRVEQKGQMSVRGGIVDLFPLTSPFPVRIEWFGDEIDSIRAFDPDEQRSTDRMESFTVTPGRELVADERRFQNAAQHAHDLLEQQLAKMADRQAKERLRTEISREIDLLRQHAVFPGLYKYVALLYPEQQTLYDYVPKDTVLVIDEPYRLIETAKQLERDEAEWTTQMLMQGKTLPALTLAAPVDQALYPKRFQTLYFSLFLRQVPHTQPQNIVNVVCRNMQNFHGQMNVLKAEMERWRKNGNRVVMLAGGAERAERMRRVLEDYQIEPPEILVGTLQNGFELPSVRLVVVTEAEMFTQKQRKARRPSRQLENAERLRSYTDLKIGDYVVHQNHGIGKYLGIGTLEVGGIHRDYLHIQYAGGDRLSVPVEQFHLIQKYVGVEDKEPKLSRLGGNDWNRVKSKVRASVQDLADDLIKLYAARQASPGYAFSKDTPYQQEFEALFPYEETPDQLRAIEEVKRDMESPRPMDRLLCGDVGYGKTEVAIRAAFKAVMDGKQVAVLVPTTILAQQHYETFRERFSGYPITIRVLSRFRSRKEQTETLRGVRTGAVDILIGTHRMLSKDVQFKDLGLLIVDEEQRFGVSHKEKLKKLKTNVDVLTLTATPIPRTLHMSLLGVRDLSLIETPPENRFPVQTFVAEYSPALVREAIERELARGGQVYYVYNRVQGIYQIAEQVRRLVPDARIVVAHGQMPEAELERAILDFLDGEYDVLVSTSIIETGVDIPNVNTLIVHDADKMGLAQLYQLRGRVGRSNRIAYAYFTYTPDKVLNEAAEKRLQSIKEFTDLGSGFKIAMRDLAIRGAGNLLGPEQHGFIASVGFEMYTQMLAEEIRKRKAGLTGEESEPEQPVSVQLDLGVDAYLPSEYIYDSAQKIEIYKKVAAAEDTGDIDELLDEMKDRFGEPPRAALNLLAVARLKVYARRLGIEAVQRRDDEIIFKFLPARKPAVHPSKQTALAVAFRGRLLPETGDPSAVRLACRGMEDDALLALAEQFLIKYEEVTKPKGELQDVAP